MMSYKVKQKTSHRVIIFYLKKITDHLLPHTRHACVYQQKRLCTVEAVKGSMVARTEGELQGRGMNRQSTEDF